MDRFSWLTSLSIWLVLGMSFMLTTSHVALLWLLRLYKYEQIHPVTWYLVVFVLLTTPCAAELVYWLWTTPIINSCARSRLPLARNVCLGVVSSILEGVASATFGVEVAHALPEPVLLTLPFSVMALDLLKDTIIRVKNRSEKSAQLSPVCHVLTVTFSSILAIYPLTVTALVGCILCFWSFFEFSLAQVLVAFVSIVLLSTIWHPEVLSLSIMSPDGKTRCSKIQIVYTIVKTAAIAITLFLSLAFKVSLFRRYPFEHLVFGVQESAQSGIFVPIMLCCFGGLFSFLLLVAASKVCLVTPVMQISMFLSPMLAIIVSAVLWNDFETGAFWEVSAVDQASWLAIVSSAVVWLLPHLTPAFRRLENPTLPNRKLQDSFYSFSWSLFFLEARNVMNYEKYSTRGSQDTGSTYKTLKSSSPKTIFICTTMYKETEVEMSRYLRSIKSTFEHNWGQQNTRVEAHVVFDSSVSDDAISLRGRHFLRLLCAMFGLQDADLLKFSTAYGCQVRIPELVNTYPMFVHFKDASKVKAKKRWSQVMYMHHVIRLRAQHTRDDTQGGRLEQNGSARLIQNLPSTMKSERLAQNGNSHLIQNLPSTKASPAICRSQNGGSKVNHVNNIRCDGQAASFSKLDLDQVYMLTTDADTEFSAKCVGRVLSLCSTDHAVGAVCGRTVPRGSSKPIVWYQKFEYAKDFWLVKSSQNIIGSVTCCPGCFSVYRGEALAGIMEEFSEAPQSAFQNLVMDHGEDRWLCTLLMRQGWRLAYSCSARNFTHCPETVGEFLRQRRRWVLSELFNITTIFLSVRSLVRENSSFSAAFLISLFTTLLWVVVSPATTLLCVCAGMASLCAVPLTFSLPVAVAIFALYVIICWFGSQRQQKIASLGLTILIAMAVLALAVGFLVYISSKLQDEPGSEASGRLKPYVMILLLSGYVIYAALLHPREVTSLVYGLAYALLFPAIFVALPVYALANMVDQSWGTREVGTHRCCQTPEEEDCQEETGAPSVDVSTLPSLSIVDPVEDAFWVKLCSTHVGSDVNVGKCPIVLADGLRRLRCQTMLLLLAVNLMWAVGLTAMYVYVGSDIICYLLMAIFSMSLILQLTGLTCYKVYLMLERYLTSKGFDVWNTSS